MTAEAGVRLEHVDVLIVGAGLSGVGAACHLQDRCPHKTFVILEAREGIGGTWDLFRFPGIRSDSDMFTLAYSFRPWRGAKAIADGRSILGYIRETARLRGIDRNIRFRHRVVRAEWSTAEARCSVTAQRTDTLETVRMTCGFLFACSGYYRYDQGYLPHFEGIERFAGQVVHPQHWPEDLDYAGKRVVVIGSGATAVTLVPAIAGRAAHVTMLQRSPSYVISLPARDAIADALRRALPATVADPLVRWKNVLLMTLIFQLSRRRPKLVKALLRRGAQRQLPAEYDVDPHFTPRYEPWDQRLCVAADGDLFKAVRAGQASVVTDEIETFTEKGIQLASGTELEADLVVTATGLNLLALGGMSIAVDGREISMADTVGYKGMMLSGVPNLALVLGYANSSWTLKSDLVSEYVCRLLEHMDLHGYRQCTPRPPDASHPTLPLIELQAGYVLRSLAALPKQGSAAPWRLHQNYVRDLIALRYARLEDGVIQFSAATADTRRRDRPAR